MRLSLVYSAVAFAVAAGVFLAAFMPHSRARASISAGPITGYAWSDTIGWIDLNCSNTSSCDANPFGLTVATNGTISGYAWSDSIGWVSANTADLSGCPVSPCAANLSHGVLSGWFKMLSAQESQSGGWDGWISLSGSDYGPSVSSGNFSGYAWGSTVVGWVDFSRARTTFDDSCTPHYYCVNADRYYGDPTDNSCTNTFQNTCSYLCTSGACVPPPAPAGTLNPGISTLMLKAVPNLVSLGNISHVSWGVSYVHPATCIVQGSNGDLWQGVADGTTFSGEAETSELEEQTTYTLHCTALDGSSVNSTTTVNIVPIFQEF